MPDALFCRHCGVFVDPNAAKEGDQGPMLAGPGPDAEKEEDQAVAPEPEEEPVLATESDEEPVLPPWVTPPRLPDRRGPPKALTAVRDARPTPAAPRSARSM